MLTRQFILYQMSIQRMFLAERIQNSCLYVRTVLLCFEWKGHFRLVLKMHRPKYIIISEW